jgi:hypothetical protein
MAIAKRRVALPERFDLQLLEVGLGEDLAIHLDHDALDDAVAFLSGERRDGDEKREDESDFLHVLTPGRSHNIRRINILA